MSLAERFYKYVRKDSSGCHIWIGGKTPKGYGRFWHRGKMFCATHVAYFLKHKKYPPRKKVICHTCDTPPCVNADHLWAGSQSQNILDAYRKGRKRQYTGENNRTSVLTSENVREIRTLYKFGSRTCGIYALGRKYKTCGETIRKIIKGVTWKNV